MKTDWNTKLIDNYPLAFRNNPDWTYANIECDSGWLTILERLFDSIESYLQTQKKNSAIRKKFKFEQIKEKFAGLRVYVSNADEKIYDMIVNTEHDSQLICECCSLAGTLCKRGGRFKTLCSDCRLIKEYSIVENKSDTNQ